MEITFLSENLGLVIPTNKLKINETESSNLALIRAVNNLKIDENERSWSVQKGFFPYFFSILVRLHNQGYFLKHFSILKKKLSGKAFKNIHR